MKAEGQKLFFAIYPHSFLNHYLHLTKRGEKIKKKNRLGTFIMEMQYMDAELLRGTAYI